MSELILIIGENPGLAGDPTAALEGSVGKRIASYAGLKWGDYLAMTERRNIFPAYVSPWPRDEAKRRAEQAFPYLLGRRTILLGQRVADAFDFHWPLLNWVEIGGVTVAIVPHPSGLNRWWNEAENRSQARRFLRAAFDVDDE